MIKEKAIAAIQRDRLSEFLKMAGQFNSGCFYYSLLMTWQRFYPSVVLPRSISEEILSIPRLLAVKPSQLQKIFLTLGDRLNLELQKVVIPSWVEAESEEIRSVFNFTRDLIIEKNDSRQDTLVPDRDSSVIIYWQDANGNAHYTSENQSERFQGPEIGRGNLGGQEGVNFAKRHGYTPILFIHVIRNS